MAALRAAYWVWRRELHGTLRAPILYVVGGVFLVVQGIAFAGLVRTLSDQRRAEPLSAVFEGQLAGTLLTWVLGLVVLTLLGMRTVVEERRSGAWELLLTAQVGEGAAVIGKWLAAIVVYALLWVPTLAYFGVLAAFRDDAGGWDVGAIACGYAGAIAIGAALLAWAIAASAAAGSTLGAGALGFGFAIVLLLVGELPELWPDLAIDHPTLASVLDAISIRSAARAFAQGEITASAVVLVGGLAVVGLSLAIVLACAGRRRAREVRRRATGTVLLAAIAGLAGVLAVQHPVRIDVSAGRANTLDPATREVLAAMPAPATLTIVRPTNAGFEAVYDEVARVAGRMAEVAPIEVRVVDPAQVPGGFDAVARAAGIFAGRLATTGAVVVDHAGRRRVVDLAAIATVVSAPDEPPRVERLAIEQAITGALAALAMATPVTACFTTGHGELPLAPRPDGADWATIADRLRAEGITVEDVALTADVPARCHVLVVAGPAALLAPAEALVVQAHVRAGRGLIVAAPVRTLTGGRGATGLEGVLAADGLGLPPAIVVDPPMMIREVQNALLVMVGYADHPINAGFARTRATVWFQPRPVVVTRGARPLVSASADSWGERDLAAEPRKDGDDLAGPVALAALGASGRVIALGSAETFSSELFRLAPVSAGDLWLVRAIRFLSRISEPSVAIGDRAFSQVHLVLSPGQRNAVVAMSVAGIPLVWLLAGGAIVLWRRRRGAR